MKCVKKNIAVEIKNSVHPVPCRLLNQHRKVDNNGKRKNESVQRTMLSLTALMRLKKTVAAVIVKTIVHTINTVVSIASPCVFSSVITSELKI